MRQTVKISDSTLRTLAQIQTGGETYSEVIDRLIDIRRLSILWMEALRLNPQAMSAWLNSLPRQGGQP